MSKSTYAVSAILAASLFFNTVEAVPCRAIALSGGGSMGSWEAGVMWGLTHYGNPEDYYWEVMTGVSAGSINTAGGAAFAPWESPEMSEWLSNNWASLHNGDIYRMWPEESVTYSLKNNVSLFDTTPALNYLRGLLAPFPEGFKKRVSIAADDLEKGEVVIFDQTNTSFYDLAQAALSSSSIPVVFPPQHFKGRVLSDGGTIWDVQIDEAIKQCLPLVDDPSEITVDVVLCGHSDVSVIEETSRTAYDNWLRQFQIHRSVTNMNSIFQEMRAYPTVNYRHLFVAQEPLGGAELLDFRNETTWPQQEFGRQQAKDMLGLGENFNGFKTLQDWNDNQESLGKEFKSFSDYFHSFFK